MFNIFSKLLGGKKKRRELDGVGIRLLASVLVCFPEIATLQYEPRHSILKITFTIKAIMQKGEFEKLAGDLAESIKTYHALMGYQTNCIEMSMDIQNDFSFLHINRDLFSLSRGELALLAEFVADRFGDSLLIDARGRDRTDPEFLATQEDLLDQMLSNTQSLRLADRLVGIREDDRVVVFDN